MNVYFECLLLRLKTRSLSSNGFVSVFSWSSTCSCRVLYLGWGWEGGTKTRVWILLCCVFLPQHSTCSWLHFYYLSDFLVEPGTELAACSWHPCRLQGICTPAEALFLLFLFSYFPSATRHACIFWGCEGLCLQGGTIEPVSDEVMVETDVWMQFIS